MSRAGAPTKLTAAIVDELASLLGSGAPLETCAGSIGVARSTVQEWMAKGSSPEYAGSVFEELAVSVARARAKWAVESYRIISEGGNGWKGRAWLAERILPELAPARQRLEHSAPAGGGIKIIPMTIELPEEIPDGHPSLVAESARVRLGEPRYASGRADTDDQDARR